MMDRSRFSLRRCYLFLGLVLGGGLAVTSCGPPDGAAVTEQARAGCEMETQQNIQTNQNMLPGRNCGFCHHSGGQATNSPWTVSGTVFASKDSPCNPGGLAGVVVEVQDDKGVPQDNGTLITNSTGNFWSAARYTTPLLIRVYQPDPANANNPPLKELKMLTPVGGMGGPRVNCADCHSFPGLQGAPGRVYLN